MTDNRTTELREKLREHGIEHEPTKFSTLQTTFTANGVEWVVTEREATGELFVEPRHGLTPEQAVAATLGRPKAKSHPYGYERDTGAYDCTRCECGCINDISATYCNDCGGEIEIDESAEKEYYDGYSKHTVFAKKHDDGSLEFCERRYVPEDAATLGSERDEIYNAGFDNGVKACLQILNGYLDYPHSAVENISKWVDEQWKEYES